MLVHWGQILVNTFDSHAVPAVVVVVVAWVQAFWIRVSQRILECVVVRVDPAFQPERITSDVATSERIIVAPPVLIEPGLRLVVLTGETQVVGELPVLRITLTMSSYGSRHVFDP